VDVEREFATDDGMVKSPLAVLVPVARSFEDEQLVLFADNVSLHR
jgi:hypothetical protein